MKKGIALLMFGNEKWIAGVYYIKNIVFQLLQNKSITDKYGIYILTYQDWVGCFDDLGSMVHILSIKKGWISKLQRCYFFARYRIKFVFPHDGNFSIRRIKSISWIADFQDSYLPEFFSKEEIESRKARNRMLANSNKAVILSSNTCLSDFEKFYSPKNKNIYVVKFVSYINSIISDIKIDYENEVLSKYDIKKQNYVCVMNQFWQHKNHKIVFDAMKMLFSTDNDLYLTFVFTGRMDDYRNPEYINELKVILENPIVSPHIRMLGFIDRKEQIIIMKNADFVIQPSLFEGWGTVVEDAKVLDKTILLSDIPVHHEQMNEKCILFDPHDSVQLAELIKTEYGKEHKDNIEKGIADMYRRAKEYSRGFEQLLQNIDD